ncbi:TPA: hypothetical protein OZE54_002701 [Staphylococcus aureus]|uniref:hypothetical protein n=1 Tax=Staphylococcus aureus TaxID=1280 RepID=UPI0009184BAA|nr:hypothetical protein [Staphylococcus aureus]MBO8573659.1 hypothetical protein [Staphylococcus aureus]MDT3909588.1 hypothetical protein [Staphylococcus aureus]UVJ30101.1 hypothetical protein NW963_14100 [Staphylococcus aureus]SHC39656.1 Uncharacterised protein [Staphylococcus aureus]HBC4807433.1 hypothetical protein [Staphylococcus aureus]
MSFKSILKLVLSILLILFTVIQIQQNHLDTWYIFYFLVYILITLDIKDKIK